IHALRNEAAARAYARRADGEREAAREPDDRLHLPVTGDVRHDAVLQPLLAVAERQLVAGAERAAMPLIVAGITEVGVQVPRERRVIGLDFAGAVVLAHRHLIVGEEEQSLRVALLEAEREPVELPEAGIRRIQNRRLERGIGYAGLDRAGAWT